MEALARDHPIDPSMIGEARMACNVLARHYGMTR